MSVISNTCIQQNFKGMKLKITIGIKVITIMILLKFIKINSEYYFILLS